MVTTDRPTDPRSSALFWSRLQLNKAQKTCRWTAHTGSVVSPPRMPPKDNKGDIDSLNFASKSTSSATVEWLRRKILMTVVVAFALTAICSIGKPNYGHKFVPNYLCCCCPDFPSTTNATTTTTTRTWVDILYRNKESGVMVDYTHKKCVPRHTVSQRVFF